MSEVAKPRPEYRNINALGDLPSYRWPLAALVSGAHRLSGVLMFLLLPFILWLFDKSVSSEISFGQFTAAFSSGLGIFGGWFIKLVVLAQVILTKGTIGYDKWAGIFASQWMKVLTFAVVVALIWHIWVGMRNVWMDYIKPVGMRMTLQALTLAWLVGCAGWAFQVLWRL